MANGSLSHRPKLDRPQLPERKIPKSPPNEPLGRPATLALPRSSREDASPKKPAELKFHEALLRRNVRMQKEIDNKLAALRKRHYRGTPSCGWRRTQ